MCVAVCALLLLPAVAGSGVWCGRVCSVRVAAAPRLSFGMCCWDVRAVVLVPRLPLPFLGGRLWRGGVLVLMLVGCTPPSSPVVLFWADLWCRTPVVPVLGPVFSVPRSLLFWAALFAVCVFFPSQRGMCPRDWGVPSPSGPLPSAWCCWLWLGGPPLPLWGVLFSVLSGWGLWPPLVVLVGGVVAVGRFCAPPPSLFSFFWGGVCLFLPLPSLDWRTHPSAFCVVFRVCCWWLRFARQCPSPMDRVGYVHFGLGAPSCRVRFWLCRVGSCARQLRVALG